MPPCVLIALVLVEYRVDMYLPCLLYTSYGILGIAKLFGCSLPTANRIKKSGKIDKAITQIGRKLIVDAELALELAGKKRCV